MRWLSLVALWCCALVAVASVAEARTQRVQFAPGATSAVLTGSIRGEESVDYILGAAAGCRPSRRLSRRQDSPTDPGAAPTSGRSQTLPRGTASTSATRPTRRPRSSPVSRRERSSATSAAPWPAASAGARSSCPRRASRAGPTASTSGKPGIRGRARHRPVHRHRRGHHRARRCRPR